VPTPALLVVAASTWIVSVVAAPPNQFDDELETQGSIHEQRAEAYLKDKL
jgi:hypothetical protein